MGFIREPEGVDFVIAPSQTAKEDVVFISNYIQEHKTQARTTNGKAEIQRPLQPSASRIENM